jgi:MFS family permease
MYSMVMFSAAVMAPVASGDIGVSPSAIGIYTPVMYFAAMLSATVCTPLLERYGPLRMSQGSLVLAAAGAALALTKLPWLVLAGAFLIGFGYGPITPASTMILVPRVHERLRATILSVKQTGVPGGGALAGAVTALLVVQIGWQGAAFVLVGCCGLLLVAIHPTHREFDRGAGARPSGGGGTLARVFEPLSLLARNGELRLLGVCGFLFSGIQIGFATYLVVYLTQDLGWGLVPAGGALAAGMITGVVGRVVWGAIADWMGGGGRLMGALGLGMSAGALGLGFAQAAWPALAVVACSVLVGGTSLGWNGVFVAEVARAAPKGKLAGATGAALTLCYAGVVVMPSLLLLVYTLTGSYGSAFLFAAVSNLLPAAILLLRRTSADERHGSSRGSP